MFLSKEDSDSLLHILTIITATFFIIGFTFCAFIGFLSHNISEALVQYYGTLDHPMHQDYMQISMAYIMAIPLFIALINQPNSKQEHYTNTTHILRQYVTHTPPALCFIALIYISRMNHPLLTLLLFIGLIQCAIVSYIYQDIVNAAPYIQQQYQEYIKNFSQHTYIQHIRETRILATPNPYNTLIQKILLPPYSDSIKKMQYLHTIEEKNPIFIMPHPHRTFLHTIIVPSYDYIMKKYTALKQSSTNKISQPKC